MIWVWRQITSSPRLMRSSVLIWRENRQIVTRALQPECKDMRPMPPTTSIRLRSGNISAQPIRSGPSPDQCPESVRPLPPASPACLLAFLFCDSISVFAPSTVAVVRVAAQWCRRHDVLPQSWALCDLDCAAWKMHFEPGHPDHRSRPRFQWRAHTHHPLRN